MVRDGHGTAIGVFVAAMTPFGARLVESVVLKGSNELASGNAPRYFQTVTKTA